MTTKKQLLKWLLTTALYVATTLTMQAQSRASHSCFKGTIGKAPVEFYFWYFEGEYRGFKYIYTNYGNPIFTNEGEDEEDTDNKCVGYEYLGGINSDGKKIPTAKITLRGSLYGKKPLKGEWKDLGKSGKTLPINLTCVYNSCCGPTPAGIEVLADSTSTNCYFKFVGVERDDLSDWALSYDKLRIYEKGTNKLLQEIKMSENGGLDECNPDEPDDFRIEDVNYDSYPDLVFRGWDEWICTPDAPTGAYRVSSGRMAIYNPESGKYELTPIGCPLYELTHDPETKTFSAVRIAGPTSEMNYTQETYRWKGVKPVLIKTEKYEPDM